MISAVQSLLKCLLVAFGVAITMTTPWARGNPEPDIPVRCDFDKTGACTIRVEIDPRCFTAQPMRERYRMKADLDFDAAADLQKWKDQASDALKRWVGFEFEPAAPMMPKFALAFTGQNEAVMTKPADPLVVTATWTFRRPPGMMGLKVKATQEARFSVVVRHFQDGVEQPRFATLFPGESSFSLRVR